MSAPFVVHPESHLDHDLSVEHLRWLLNQGREHHEEWGLGEGHVVVRTIELPLNMDGLVCGLYGPAVGDPPIAEGSWPGAQVRMEKRPGRDWVSRRLSVILPWTRVGLDKRRSRLITIVVGPHGELPAVLFTAYGGPSAPREPGDPDLPDADRDESEHFWAEHALVW